VYALILTPQFIVDHILMSL